MPAAESGGWATHRLAFDSETGASLIEYSLLIALIAVVCVASLQAFGQSVPAASFDSVTSSLGN